VASWSLLDYDWRRISRWCLLGAIVMCLWLLAPVAKCSYYAFRDIPLDENDTAPIDPTKADQQRVDDGKNFVGGWVQETKYCYRRTPLLDQEPWKTNVLFGFVGVAVLGFTLHRLRKPSRPR
jgi:hypothetical protein